MMNSTKSTPSKGNGTTGGALAAYLNKTNLPAIDDQQLAAALDTAVNDTTTGGGDRDYLTFSGKSGHYAVGKNRTEPDHDAVYAVEPAASTVGWVCWKGSKVAGRHEWSVLKPENAVKEVDLDDFGPYKQGEGWSQSLSIGIVDLGNGRSIQFSSTSVSGRNAIGDLIRSISDRAKVGEPYIPVITFGAEQFTAQDQTNWKPVIDVSIWTDRDAVQALLNGDLPLEDLLSGDAPRKRPQKRARR